MSNRLIKKPSKILYLSPILISKLHLKKTYLILKNIKNFSPESKLSKPKSLLLLIVIVTNNLKTSILKLKSLLQFPIEMDSLQCIHYSKVKSQNLIPILSTHPLIKSNFCCYKSNSLKDKILSLKRKSEISKNKSMVDFFLSNMKTVNLNIKINKVKKWRKKEQWN